MLHCDHCGAKVKMKDQICPVCNHLLTNDIKLRRILVRITLIGLAALLCLGAGIVIGRLC